MASWSREFLQEFIELYKSLEPLWSTKSKGYHHYKRRKECYNMLLEKVTTIDPSATRDTITKKINNIRSSFRKEYKKVLSSIASGASGDDIYKPRLWYYNELLFLKDHEDSSNADFSIEGTEIQPRTIRTQMNHKSSDPLFTVKNEGLPWSDNESEEENNSYEVPMTDEEISHTESRVPINGTVHVEEHKKARVTEQEEELHKLRLREKMWLIKTMKEQHRMAQIQRERAEFERDKAQFERDKAQVELEKAHIELKRAKRLDNDNIMYGKLS